MHCLRFTVSYSWVRRRWKHIRMYILVSRFSFQYAIYICAAKERVGRLLVKSNIQNRQREALPEIREILEDVETKPKDAKIR